MAEWFVFIDTDYYPYVANPVERDEDGHYRYVPIVADRPEDVFVDGPSPDNQKRVGRPTGCDEVFVVPWDQVVRFDEETPYRALATIEWTDAHYRLIHRVKQPCESCGQPFPNPCPRDCPSSWFRFEAALAAVKILSREGLT